jgi:uncharacterized repeat protein (TIGR01451 family)
MVGVEEAMGHSCENDSQESHRAKIIEFGGVYAAALLSGDGIAIREAMDAKLTTAEIDDEIIAPALWLVGELWERGEISVADEHIATEISIRVLALQREAQRVAQARGSHRILLAAAAGELHVVALRMVGNLLHDAGYDTVMLGANVPTDALAASARRYQPDVICLSSTVASPAHEVMNAIDDVRQQWPAANIVAGHVLTYTLRATNTSATTAATGVTITDPVPGAVRVTNAAASQGSCSRARTVVCALGQLAPGASATVKLAVIAGGARWLVNTASVSGDQPDPNTANNVATATTAVVAPPAVSTGPEIAVLAAAGLVSGAVNPEGLATSYHFEYGTSTAYGHRTHSRRAGVGRGDRFVTAVLTRLQRGKTYHYRLAATNAAGTTRGADQSVRMTSAPRSGRTVRRRSPL